MVEPTGSSGEGTGDREPEDEAIAALRRVPPLALVALVAALFELALARLGWHGLTDRLDPQELLELGRMARFPRNLAAVSGIVALTFGLLAFLRLPGFAPIGRRLAVAAFSGIFVPSIVVATVLPHAAVRRKLVVFGLAAANVLVTLLGMTAVRHRPGPGLRLAVGLATATAFLSLAVVGLGQIVHAQEGLWAPLAELLEDHPTTTTRFLLGMRHLGELCWLGTILGAAWTGVVGDDLRAGRRRIAAAAGLATLFVVLIVASQGIVGHRFRLVMFGAFRLGLIVDDFPTLYALPLGLGLAGGAVCLARSEPAVRQLGAGILIWLAAGYAPHTPIQLLYLVLGAMLLTRSAQALDHDDTWRERQPWSRFAPRAPRPSRPPPIALPEVERETWDDLEPSEAPSAERVDLASEPEPVAPEPPPEADEADPTEADRAEGDDAGRDAPS